MLRLMGQYANQWNGFGDDVGNQRQGLALLRSVIDEACDEVGRDPTTLPRSVTVLIANESAEPWWEDMPFDNDADVGALKPLIGAPEQIAATLREFVAEGARYISTRVHRKPSKTSRRCWKRLTLAD
jgi:alkanesulfonate monooxygenase SsuD/methylene tetrahydromethanopterin reductase-like flavin-dependent oxidoreductase (luciferase family)